MKLCLPLGAAMLALSGFPVRAQPPENPTPITVPEPNQPAPAAPVDPEEQAGRYAVAMADTPTTVLNNFVGYYNAADSSMMARFVVGADPDSPLLPNLNKEFEASIGEFKLGISDIEVTEEGDGATASMKVTLRHRLRMNISQIETLRLRHENTKWGVVWHIVPEPDEFETNESFLSRLALYVAYPDVMLKWLSSEESMTQVKSLSLGLMQYLQDYDEKFAFTPETFKEAISPYIKDKALFTAPNDAPDTQSYAVNPNLPGRTLAQIAEPSKIVAIYLGRDGKLVFRFDGKAVVGFADGHVELVDKAQAETLRWKP